ncbi:MAG TPA: hypothetical protein VNO34_01930 [Actinomycetota bacterium]|nr:hypothetical protein [Actinomycetota bacterium]
MAAAERAARTLVALLDHPDPSVQRRAACLILDLLGIGPTPTHAAAREDVLTIRFERSPGRRRRSRSCCGTDDPASHRHVSGR